MPDTHVMHKELWERQGGQTLQVTGELELELELGRCAINNDC